MSDSLRDPRAARVAYFSMEIALEPDIHYLQWRTWCSGWGHSSRGQQTSASP
jgi:hypothetical protein